MSQTKALASKLINKQNIQFFLQHGSVLVLVKTVPRMLGEKYLRAKGRLKFRLSIS